jgi:hypothetical protein
MLTDNNILAVWTDLNSSLIGEVFSQDGSIYRSRFTIANATDMGTAWILPLTGGGFLVGWVDFSSKMWGRQYNADYTAKGSQFVLSPAVGTLYSQAILTTLEDDSYVAVATFDSSDQQSRDVFA